MSEPFDIACDHNGRGLYWCKHCEPSLRDLLEWLELATARAEKAEAFKAWTHAYLDAQGVPHHPPGPHGAEGCRIGDRMDWLMARLRAAEAEVRRLQEQVRGLCDRVAAQSELLSRKAEATQ